MRDEPNAGLRCRNGRSSDTTKGVDSSRQPDGGHGSWNPLRSVLRTPEVGGLRPPALGHLVLDRLQIVAWALVL